MATALRPAPRTTAGAPEAVLRQRLARLRRRAVMVPVARGAAWLVAAVLAAAVVVGLADYQLHLPPLVRAAALAGLLAGGGALLYRLTVVPLAGPRDDLSLALRVEEANPALNDALASTVQFLARESVPDGESASMRGEVVRQALRRAEGVDFNRVVDSRGLRLAVALAVLALGVGGLAVVARPRLAGTAVARLASPFGGVEWPRKTRIELADVPRRVGRNREVVIQGTVSGVVPEEGTLELVSEGLPVQRRTFAIRDGAFKARLKADEVQKSFQFRVLANDAATRAHEVEVLTLPQLALLGGQHSPQLVLAPPAYTDLPSPRREAPGVGSIDTVTGTVVTLRAAADRPLARAWLECYPEPRDSVRSAPLGVVGQTSPLGVAGALLLAGRLTPRTEAALSADRRELTATFRAEVMGAYTLSFEDENGLVNSKTYELRVRPDPVPTVRLDRPSPTRDLLSVLPGAELPLQLTVEDTQFAVRSVWLEYRTRPDESPRRVGLYDHAAGLNRAVGPLAGVGAVALPVPRLRLQRLELDRALSLRSLRHASGAVLADGDEVQLQACADDFDDVSPTKGPGRSHVVTVRVVSREAFEVILNQEQGRVQQELVRARERQREAIARVKEVEARLRKGGVVAPDRQAAEAEELAQKLQSQALAEEEKAEQAATQADRERHRQAAEALRSKAKKEEERAAELKRQAAQLSDAEQLQQAIRERVGSDKEGLRAEVERLRETLRQNGMASSSAMDRMKQVADALGRMAGSELQQIEPKLAEARKQAELLDEKTRAARQAALKEQAAAAEKEAQAAGREAKALAERAEGEARKAEKAPDAAARARAGREAQRLRAEAKARSEAAARKRSEAEEARKQAAERPTPDKARQALAEARKHQDEVEKSLGALLRDLEPWSSTREIKGEAGRILQDQKDLQAQREALAERLKDRGPADLKEEEKADLEALEDAQKRLEERTAQLLDKMKRMAEKQGKADPQTAREMKETAQEAEKDGVVAQMKSAREAIKGNQLHQAGAKQQEAVKGLQKMVRNLEDRREAELDRLARKMREQERAIEGLMDEQERLQKKVRDAGKLPEKQRDEELKRLAKEQARLQQKAKEIAEELSRLRNERARQAMGRAGEEMGEANQQLSRGQRDEEKQDDVLDRLEEARRELERARKKAEEELGREQLVRVADVIRRIRERQAGHVAEAKRVQDAAQEQKRWERGLKASLNRLGDNQAGLAAETRAVVKKDLNGAPVFAKLLERAARSMEQASARLKGMVRVSPDVADLPDAEASRRQGDALRRLDQLLGSLKEAMDSPRPLSQSGGGEGGEGGGGGGGGAPGDDSLPPPAQVRLLRAMQKEVNDRTEAFRKKHPEAEKLDAKARAELQEVRQEQKEVADLLELLLGPGEGPGDGDEGADVEMKKDRKAEKEGGE